MATPSSPTNCMKFENITNETSQGPSASVFKFVVRCGIWCSNSLSNSMVNATKTWERSVGKGRVAGRKPLRCFPTLVGDCIEDRF